MTRTQPDRGVGSSQRRHKVEPVRRATRFCAHYVPTTVGTGGKWPVMAVIRNGL